MQYVTLEGYSTAALFMGIGWSMLARPLLSRIDSERAHGIAIRSLSGFGQTSAGIRALNTLYQSPELPTHVFGRLFRHPLGLAAGMDKDASALSAWPALGFSWVEYGGITRFPQEGNPKPRMFRADAEQALVNSMGFNNPGASSIRDQLIRRRAAGKWPNVPVAANIGRSKKVDNAQAPSDYSATLETLWDHADFFVLNISSPNTPGLRDLHEESSLSSVLRACKSVREMKGGGKQILLKLSPDASDEDLVVTSEEALKNGVDGIVATNTTLKRPIPKNTKSRHAFAQNGGVSGRPLQSRSLDVVSMLYESTDGKVPIVGVGGIDSADSAWNSVTSGASLLQLYSALVFKGPSVVSNIVRGLRSRVRENGFSSIDEAVGYNNV